MIKTKCFITIFLALIYVYGHSQSSFQKTYGGSDQDYGTIVLQTTDGGYVISGSTWSYGPGMGAIYLIKTSSMGDTLWTKVYGGSVTSGGIESIQQTPDGGYIIGSATKSFGAGYQDVYIIKTSVNGTIIWTKTFGGIDIDLGYSIRQTSDGGYVILGYTESFGVGSGNIYLIKMNSIGNPLWKKTYGGTNYDFGNCIQQTTDGGYIITGRTNSFGAGDYDAYLIKTNSTGDTLWTNTYGGPNFENGNVVLQVDSGYVIVGFTSSFGAGLRDVYLIKTDTLGNLTWSKTYGGANNDAATWIESTNNGGYIISGYTQSYGAGMMDVYLIKTNSSGDTTWTKSFGGPNDESGYSVSQTTDDGYIITGQMKVGAYADVYLIKTDSLGNSGCNNQYNTNTNVGSPSTIIGSYPVQVYSAGGTTGTTSTIVSQGATVNNPCLSVGMEKIEINEIENVFPNPFSRQAFLKTDKFLNNASLTIYNSFGQQVMKINNIRGQTIELQRGNLKSGIYFIQLLEESKLISTNKIIITD